MATEGFSTGISSTTAGTAAAASNSDAFFTSHHYVDTTSYALGHGTLHGRTCITALATRAAVCPARSGPKKQCPAFATPWINRSVDELSTKCFMVAPSYVYKSMSSDTPSL